MELPYAFQCCAFISCEMRGEGLSWEREEAADSTARDAPFLSSLGKHRKKRLKVPDAKNQKKTLMGRQKRENMKEHKTDTTEYDAVSGPL